MALSQREKRLLLIPVVVGLVIGFYSYVHEPLFTRRAEAAERREKVSTDLSRSQTRLAGYGNIQAKADAVAAREKVIDAWVPGKNSAALLIWYLSQVEMHSGARIKGIKVGDKKQVTSCGCPADQNQQAQGAQTAPAPGTNQPAPTAPQAPQAQPNQAQPNQAQPNGGTVATTLTVVRLELAVNARFAQHLQFNQGLEEMPLFLNTSALAMSKDLKTNAEEAAKLTQDGNSWLAAQLLGASPTLSGTYKVDLYFKVDKQGPTTDAMSFAEAAGRTDPFAFDGVDEFLQTILQFYQNGGAGGGRGPLPVLPEDLRGQLG